ncbi:MAG: site-specific integrase [Ferruginibacter sp.]
MNKTTDNFSVVFHLRTSQGIEGRHPLYARITINRKRIELSVKQQVAVVDWDNSRGRAINKTPEGKALNIYVDQLRSSYVACYREMTLQKKLITPETFKNEFFGNTDTEYTLGKLMDYHNIDMKDSLSHGTMKNYYTTQKYLDLFVKERLKRKDVLLKEINYKFVNDFANFLRNWRPKDHQKPLGNNGLMKHMERFRKVTNLAIRNEWITKDPFIAFRFKLIHYSRGYLTREELAVIEIKDFSIERLDTVRDLFVFSCYTGVAYIDAVSLKPANITDGFDGEKWLMLNRAKTNTSVKVPLLPRAIELVEKYKHHPRCIADGSLLPKMSNQRLNGYLKEMADLCGIEKNLTFHLARHTFATTVTLTNGVPMESVSKMLGHTKLSTTELYAKVVKRKLSEDMLQLKNKLANGK